MRLPGLKCRCLSFQTPACLRSAPRRSGRCTIKYGIPDSTSFRNRTTEEKNGSDRTLATGSSGSGEGGEGDVESPGGRKYPSHPQTAGLQTGADGGVEHCHRAGTAPFQRLSPLGRDGGERLRSAPPRGAALRPRHQCLRAQLRVFAAGTAVPAGAARAGLTRGCDRRKRAPRGPARARRPVYRGRAGQEPAVAGDRRRRQAPEPSHRQRPRHPCRAAEVPGPGALPERCRVQRPARGGGGHHEVLGTVLTS
jgi:hypothetical protein